MNPEPMNSQLTRSHPSSGAIPVPEDRERQLSVRPDKDSAKRQNEKSVRPANARVVPGARFGRWTILEDVQMVSGRNGKTVKKVLCRCDCGTERYVLERSLLYGGSESCGCLRKENAKEANSYDLTGRTFGELQVIQESHSHSPRKGRWWLCCCSCGNTYLCAGSLLVTGRRTHCGCKTDRGRPADITGQRFHQLTALSIAKRMDPKDGVVWHCRCDCGNEVDVSYNNLVFGNQISCGCRKREHDKKLGSFLTHVAGTSVDILKSKKIPTDNTTGCKGVYWIRGKYVAKIVFQKKAYYLGTYENIEQAAQARLEAEEVLFDAAAEYYDKWRRKADADPAWASENPIRIQVTQNEDKRLSLSCFPVL